ncbi:MAG: leucyl/phenylalanyl-tRNA--protein transferase [Methylococcaceae bacterium]|nr:leucyl/phenylalanyl-tRNA--protein transferase [Methylococcaceae bacterium]
MKLTILDPKNPRQAFPPLNAALIEPDGLLAAGGCLSPTRLINAYQSGIFPWFNPDEPILWWSPNPRLILKPEDIKVSRSLAKTIRKQRFTLTVDTAFAAVLEACAAPRDYAMGTWITDDMMQAYNQLHRIGTAHSAEAWLNDELVGGLYGVAIGKVFFGESMFHTQTDASKVVFVELVKQLGKWGYELIDCQVHSEHLVSLGAYEVSRETFIEELSQYRHSSPNPEAWTLL